MPMTTASSKSEFACYLAAFDEFSAGQTVPEWLMSLRRSGISHFTELGFPTQKQEEWIFTNTRPISEMEFKPASALPAVSIELDLFSFAGLTGSRLVFVDGHYSAPHSEIGNLPDGVVVSNLATAMTENEKLVEQHLGKHQRTDACGFSALNAAFVRDGAVIHLPPGKVVEEPIHLLFISTDGEANTATIRNLIVAEPNARAKVIESYYSAGVKPHFTNVVTELVVNEGAHLEHCKFQEQNQESFHVAAIQAQLDKDVHFTNHSISTGARIARNDINLAMNGQGIDCVLNGLYVVDGGQLVDHHTLADHAKPNCGSHEFYHGILGGRSRGVFNGKIYVREDAQKTDAKQTSRAILLSNKATVNAKPQLEIYADDVKCTHGATVGQLNREAVFYCRSRGIDESNARRLLTHAFASEVINRISIVPVRDHLEALLWDRLEQLIED